MKWSRDGIPHSNEKEQGTHNATGEFHKHTTEQERHKHRPLTLLLMDIFTNEKQEESTGRRVATWAGVGLQVLPRGSVGVGNALFFDWVETIRIKKNMKIIWVCSTARVYRSTWP